MVTIKQKAFIYKTLYYLIKVVVIMFGILTFVAFAFPFEIIETLPDGSTVLIGPKALYRDAFFGLSPAAGMLIVLALLVIKTERDTRRAFESAGITYTAAYQDFRQGLRSMRPTITFPRSRDEWLTLGARFVSRISFFLIFISITFCHMIAVFCLIGGLLAIRFLPEYTTTGYLALMAAGLLIIVPYLLFRKHEVYQMLLEGTIGPFALMPQHEAKAMITEMHDRDPNTVMQLPGRPYWPYSGAWTFGERYVRVTFKDPELGAVDTAVRVGKRVLNQLTVGQSVPVQYQKARIGSQVRARLINN